MRCYKNAKKGVVLTTHMVKQWDKTVIDLEAFVVDQKLHSISLTFSILFSRVARSFSWNVKES